MSYTYKSVHLPSPVEGKANFAPKMVVPNQALTMQEILERFTRGEALPIGKEFNFWEGDEDLEKISKLDITQRMEFIEHQKDVKKRWEEQERKREIREEAERLNKEAAAAKAADSAKADNTP